MTNLLGNNNRSYLLFLLWFTLVVYSVVHVPYYAAVFIVLFVATIAAIHHDLTKYFKKLEEMNIDFKLRMTKQDFTIKEFTRRVFIAVLAFWPLFVNVDEHMYERAYSIFYPLYAWSFLLLTAYMWFKNRKFRFFYFTDEYLILPGEKLQKINWDDILHITGIDNKNELYLITGDNKHIKLNLDVYYIRWQSKEEILDYISQRIRKNAEP